MCGIFGFSTLNDNTRALIPVLAAYMADRGRDSWGCTNGTNVYRALGSITRTFNNEYDNWDCSDGLIFHTRGASAGMGVTIDNCHPFLFSKPIDDIDNDKAHRVVCGIHNGYISNHYALKNKYRETRSEFGVDSKHIFKHIVDDVPLSELNGSAAIAFFDTKMTFKDNPEDDLIHETGLYFAKLKNDALHTVVLATGELVFASTITAIEAAVCLSGQQIKSTLLTESDYLYQLGINNATQEVCLYRLKKLDFGSKPVEFAAQTQYPGGHGGNRQVYYPENHGYAAKAHEKMLDENHKFCYICGTGIDPAIQAMCESCYGEWLSGDISIWSSDQINQQAAQ